MTGLPNERIIYICCNERDDEQLKPSCGKKGSKALVECFQTALDEREIHDIEVVENKCLGACQNGPTVFIYPDNIWYGHVTPDDVKEIVTEHFAKNRPLKRLFIQSIMNKL